MQKFINEPARAVADYLRGLEAAHSRSLRVNLSPRYVVRADAPVRGKVCVISGSGSGHEPLTAGYVGKGMLDAAIPGDIFTSPTPDQYLAAIDALNGGQGGQGAQGGQGVVLIVKNYAGGVLNTEMAMEMATEAGIPIAAVLVSDDVAVPDRRRRRGMGAAVLVAKIAGAAAEAGYSFEQVLAVARRASANAGSMGVALSGCTSPTVGAPAFRLPVGQMEIGVGIHGEAGRRRGHLLGAGAIAGLLLEAIVSDLDLHAGERVLALVSGLGGTPQQELYIVYGHVHRALEAQGVRVERSLVGEYITSLDMAGATITLMRLDDELLRLWDAPVRTPTLHW